MKLLILLLTCAQLLSGQVFIRINQLGFVPSDQKTAVVLSEQRLSKTDFRIIDNTSGQVALSGTLTQSKLSYGSFPFVYIADFSSLTQEGEFILYVPGASSAPFRIGRDAYRQYLNYPMVYLLQQRCGYNPVFDTTCHQYDAIAVDGPDSGKVFDMRGGYHDASDYLRFLITTSYTVGILLLSYIDYPTLWGDELNALGKNDRNGIPDILDEARWGLDWMLKLNPEKGKLYHQVADDRDHSFWDLPFKDSTDYGWGSGKHRPAYFATGKPQGLFQYKNSSTGVSNVAGRTAAVFALASAVWNEKLHDATFASLLLAKAEELYEMGKTQLGASESVPCKAPYRFHEKTFYDDLEWAATELHRTTKKRSYLQDALTYAQLAADTSWMAHDTTHHYEYFPYVNPAHYRLHEIAGVAEKQKLREYFRRGLLKARQRADKNAFNYGVPPIWVSNNLCAGLVTQAVWYKKMSGSTEFDDLLASGRDWLLGRNPWGQSFVLGVPETGRYPTEPHTVVGKELGLRLTGALVDGPVYGSIFRSLRGLRLTREDQFARFQSDSFVYHDDLGDYSTNEPTIDGTASMLYILATFAK